MMWLYTVAVLIGVMKLWVCAFKKVVETTEKVAKGWCPLTPCKSPQNHAFHPCVFERDTIWEIDVDVGGVSCVDEETLFSKRNRDLSCTTIDFIDCAFSHLQTI